MRRGRWPSTADICTIMHPYDMCAYAMVRHRLQRGVRFSRVTSPRWRRRRRRPSKTDGRTRRVQHGDVTGHFVARLSHYIIIVIIIAVIIKYYCCRLGLWFLLRVQIAYVCTRARPRFMVFCIRAVLNVQYTRARPFVFRGLRLSSFKYCNYLDLPSLNKKTIINGRPSNDYGYRPKRIYS